MSCHECSRLYCPMAFSTSQFPGIETVSADPTAAAYPWSHSCTLLSFSRKHASFRILHIGWRRHQGLMPITVSGGLYAISQKRRQSRSSPMIPGKSVGGSHLQDPSRFFPERHNSSGNQAEGSYKQDPGHLFFPKRRSRFPLLPASCTSQFCGFSYRIDDHRGKRAHFPYIVYYATYTLPYIPFFCKSNSLYIHYII